MSPYPIAGFALRCAAPDVEFCTRIVVTAPLGTNRDLCPNPQHKPAICGFLSGLPVIGRGPKFGLDTGDSRHRRGSGPLLSRRRSRVRVPSLPSRESPGNQGFFVGLWHSGGTRWRRRVPLASTTLGLVLQRKRLGAGLRAGGCGCWGWRRPCGRFRALTGTCDCLMAAGARTPFRDCRERDVEIDGWRHGHQSRLLLTGSDLTDSRGNIRAIASISTRSVCVVLRPEYRRSQTYARRAALIGTRLGGSDAQVG